MQWICTKFQNEDKEDVGTYLVTKSGETAGYEYWGVCVYYLLRETVHIENQSVVYLRHKCNKKEIRNFNCYIRIHVSLGSNGRCRFGMRNVRIFFAEDIVIIFSACIEQVYIPLLFGPNVMKKQKVLINFNCGKHYSCWGNWNVLLVHKRGYMYVELPMANYHFE